MSEKGTILDDCIITKVNENEFYVVLNAGCKTTDLAHIKKVIDTEFASDSI
jgi:aminomethyltransferase